MIESMMALGVGYVVMHAIPTFVLFGFMFIGVVCVMNNVIYAVVH